MKIKRKSLDLLKKVVVRTLIFFCVFVLVYWYFGTGFFSVTSYELIGVESAHKDAVERGLNDIVSKKQYKIFPGDKIFSLPERKMKLFISTTLPDTEHIVLRISGLHTVKVTVTPFVPLFREDESHAITKDAYVYKDLNNLSLYPTLVISSSTKETEVKNGVTLVKIVGVEKADLLAWSSLIQKVNSVLFIVSKVFVDEYGDVYFYDERGMSTIKFSRTTSPDKVWSNIVSSVDTEPLKSKLIANKSTLEYLDARFGNKVFYRFTNEGKTAIIQHNNATSTSTTAVPVR